MDYNIEEVSNELLLLSILLKNLEIIDSDNEKESVDKILLKKNRYIYDNLIKTYFELHVKYTIYQNMSEGYKDMADINQTLSQEFFNVESEAINIYEVD